jgi:hypothetical protein
MIGMIILFQFGTIAIVPYDFIISKCLLLIQFFIQNTPV